MDIKIIYRFNKGGQGAFRQIFTEIYPAACLFAKKYLKDQMESEDVVQEVFIELWNQRQKFTSINHIKSFVYLSVKNKCINSIKHARVKEKYFTEHAGITDDYYFEENLVNVEVAGIIRNIIGQLPGQRKKIILLNMQGLNNPEIADALKISVNTVKLQKKIAYGFLRDKLSKNLLALFFLNY